MHTHTHTHTHTQVVSVINRFLSAARSGAGEMKGTVWVAGCTEIPQRQLNY